MDKVAHTAGPVKACGSVDGDFFAIYPDTGRQEFPICKMPDFVRASVNKANAERIALTWNCHDDLVKALKWAEAALAPFSKEPAEKSGINMMRAALAKASPPSSTLTDETTAKTSITE
jgi:hypothetical protein